ncbi:MAG: phospholipase [Planctomycetota bacterium]|jgi:phospholipase/carboxylesterase|nr:MAG: phospholipase [Planctomycetota bacterium]
MKFTQRAGLDCCELPPRGETEMVVVLCHGFGAPGDDLVPIGQELAREVPSVGQSVRFVFPQAPLSLDASGWGDARAWWMIDMIKLQLAQQTGQMRDLRTEKPAGMAEARDQLVKLLIEVQVETGVPWSKIVLGGFSQGAMIAVETIRHLPEHIGGAVLYSGTLINESEWKVPSPNIQGLPIVQSHGRTDVILPYSLSLELKNLLEEQGATMRFVEFAGGHTIPHSALQATVELLLSV